MIGSSRTYAIGMAHYQLGGGNKSLVAGIAGYLVISGSLLGLYFYERPHSVAPHQADVLISILLMFLQLVALVIYGGFRITTAIRGDIVSRMLESHRLMPIPAWRAILGYMLGATAQGIAVAAINFLYLLIFTSLGAIRLGDLLTFEVTVVTFTLFIWSISALMTLMIKPGLAVGLAALGAIGAGGIAFGGSLLLPGVALLINPFHSNVLFGVPGTSEYAAILFFSVVMQAGFFALNLAGACRRYRGTYLTTLNVFEALAVPCWWGLATLIGFHYLGHIGGYLRMATGEQQEDLWRARVIASLIASMVLTFWPVGTVYGERVNGIGTTLRVWLVTGAAALAAAIPMLAALQRENYRSEQFLITLVVTAAHVITAYSAMTLLPRKKKRLTTGVTLIVLGYVLWWFGPLFCELLRQVVSPRSEFGLIGNLSPLGLLGSLWANNDAYSLWFAAAMQCAMAALIAGIAMIRMKSNNVEA